MKKQLAAVISAFMTLALVFSLTACAPSKTENTGNADAKKKIGIVQIVEHPSLNTIRESLIAELQAQGYKDGETITIDYQNAQGDQTNLKTIAQKFVSNKYDLIVAIATPSAQAVVSETKDIPILFSACTDPLGSGLVTDMEKPGGNVTGTSDAVSAEKIMELGKRITPDIKTIGALYNSSETNSVSVINELKEYAQKNNMTVVDATVTNSSEVQQAVTSLVDKVDALFSPIDNTVASAMPLVTQIANRAKKPIYVGADSMVKDGGLATYGINYQVLGKETGIMAVEILKGKKAGDIPVKTMKDMDIYLNKTTAKAIGINLSDDVLKEAAQVFEN
ncbi:ABC transporter substrate-binding protein [Desulfosporosinus nitroreducens]|uniref:ABC transporter substrate-binding protein n=1 Tax=Desulfosporosinus nitroreducens TaxID=2018668 RepID=A0ABT8QLZ1_9FIRM|nr:ABC transporter substrate-binding protein [Desulfosporosinus nitroreducens]MCO1600681.1 ABC transporter substrate-binding protein [Desulfosporosinus nitroreducens]MDO0822357.1 ABC transporter substrate-binding protein [Desulfosporosinus nitroreducens]